MQRVNWTSNERVDIPDLQAATGDLAVADQQRRMLIMELPDGRDTGEAGTEGRVLDGFDVTGSLPSATVTLGAGFGVFPLYYEGALHHALVVGNQGASSYVLDASTLGNDDYAVYVRFVVALAEAANRVFWNPSAGPAAEQIDNVQTRRQLLWEVHVRSASAGTPGDGEWMKVWELTVVANQFTVKTDFRHTYFEGSVHTSDAYANEWGTGNDRNADRAAYGVKDWHKAWHALRRQLAEIIGAGAADWYVLRPISLTNLAATHWATGGDEGKHKDLSVGATTRWWQVATLDVVGPPAAQQFEIRALENGAGARVKLYVTDDSTIAQVVISPRNGAMVPGDSVYEITGGTDFQEFRKLYAANRAEIEWTTGGGAGAMTFKDGAGVVNGEQGLHVTGGGLYLDDRTVTYLVPWSTTPWTATPGDSPDWQLVTGADADVVTNEGYLQTLAASKKLLLEVYDFPHGATLNWIDVEWERAAAAPATEMKLYAARYIVNAGTGEKSSGATKQQLKSGAGNQALTYDRTGWTGYRGIQRYTPNQFNTGWSRQTTKLVLGLASGSTAQAYMVYQITTNWTYRQVTPWPTS